MAVIRVLGQSAFPPDVCLIMHVRVKLHVCALLYILLQILFLCCVNELDS